MTMSVTMLRSAIHLLCLFLRHITALQRLLHLFITDKYLSVQASPFIEATTIQLLVLHTRSQVGHWVTALFIQPPTLDMTKNFMKGRLPTMTMLTIMATNKVDITTISVKPTTMRNSISQGIMDMNILLPMNRTTQERAIAISPILASRN
jgi:hypothetical protein